MSTSSGSHGMTSTSPAVFDLDGLCLSRGSFTTDAELRRAVWAMSILRRSSKLEGSTDNRSESNSAASSGNQLTIAQIPILTRSRSGTALTRAYDIGGSSEGSAVPDSIATSIDGLAHMPQMVTIELSSDTIHVVASSTYITVSQECKS